MQMKALDTVVPRAIPQKGSKNIEFDDCHSILQGELTAEKKAREEEK